MSGPMTHRGGSEASDRFIVYLWRKLPMSLNDRYANWGHKGAVTGQTRQEAAWRIRAANIGRAKRVRVQLCWRPATRRVRDASNAMATQKPVVDAMRDAGVVPDDDSRFVDELMPRLLEPAGRDRAGVWVVIEVLERP